MLTISPLTLGYGGAPVMRFPGLTLESGGQCLITGASGSGKTTLLYAIAGLVAPLDGQIMLDGTHITALSEAPRDRFRGRHIGLIFQTLHLVKSLSVLQNLLLASYAAGKKPSRERALALLAQLGIADKQQALPEALSQGQAQRVAIARSLLNQPQLILADEPTSSLDDANCELVIALLKQVAQEHQAALIVSTHDSRVKAHFSQVVTL